MARLVAAVIIAVTIVALVIVAGAGIARGPG